MNKEQMQLIKGHFDVLKQTMKKEGFVFAIIVNKDDSDKSSLAIMDRHALSKGEHKGISIKLEELNRGLI
jgi:hypothetical protein